MFFFIAGNKVDGSIKSAARGTRALSNGTCHSINTKWERAESMERRCFFARDECGPCEFSTSVLGCYSLNPVFTLDKIRRSRYSVSLPHFLTEISTRYLTRLGINIRNISETPFVAFLSSPRRDKKRSRKRSASLCERSRGKGSAR